MNTEMCCADVCLAENKILPGVSFGDVMERPSRDSFFCISLILFSASGGASVMAEVEHCLCSNQEDALCDSNIIYETVKRDPLFYSVRFPGLANLSTQNEYNFK